MDPKAHTTATVSEMLAIKRLITLLHADYHNPGFVRCTEQRADLDALVDDYLYRIDHMIENAR